MRGLSITQTLVLAAIALTTAVGPSRTPARSAVAERRVGEGVSAAVTATIPLSPADTTYPTGVQLVGEYLRAGGAPPAECKPATRIAQDLVVIVPDPRGSHLDWAFDSVIESLRRAHERVGYVLDRYWFPWGPAADSIAKRVDSGKLLPLPMRAPGVMVFRSSEPLLDSLAVVWLVGETPTRGVHSVALHAALDDRDRLLTCRPTDTPHAPIHTARRRKESQRSQGDSTRQDSMPIGPRANEVVRIVGPVASGSARSLRLALEQWRGQTRRHVSIVTGGATAPNNAITLRSCPDTTGSKDTRSSSPIQPSPQSRLPNAEPRPLDTTRGCLADDWLTFTSTVNSVDALKRSIERFLHNGLSIRQSEIAYLTESGTAYGRSFEASSPKDSAPVAATGRGDSPGNGRASKPPLRAKPDPTLRARIDSMPLEIPFPMNISRLRREYARLPAAVDTQKTPTPGWRTRLSWEDPSSSSETPEVLSDLTPAMIERTISDIEQTLLLHKIRAVGILATDIRDRLFVASLIRERLRDVRVFFIGSNSLYLRPELNRELRGSLVVSTYPLFLETQFWDLTFNRDRQRLVFASDLSEGTYNATLLQLGHPDKMLDYIPPMPDTSSRVWRESSPPPVWITIVGRSAMLPVFVDSVRSDGAIPYTYLRDPPVAYRLGVERPSSRPFEIVVTITLITLFGFAFIVHLLGTERTIRRNLHDVTDLIAGSWSALAAGTVAGASAVGHAFGRGVGLFRGQRAKSQQNQPGRPITPPPAQTTATPPPSHEAEATSSSVSPWDAIRLTLFWHRHSWILFRFMAMVCAFAPLLLILFRPRAHGSSRSQAGFWLITAVIGLTAAWSVVVWLRGLDEIVPKHPAETRNQRKGYIPGLTFPQVFQHVLLWVIGLAYVAVTAWLVGRVTLGLDDSTAALFFLRAMQLDSGVTPVMPLLLGGSLLVLWATWHVDRVKLLTHMSAFEAAWRPKCEVTHGPWRKRVRKRFYRWLRLLVHGNPTQAEKDVSLDSMRNFSRTVTEIRDGLLRAVPGTGAWILIAGMALVSFTTLLQFNRSVESAILGSLADRAWYANPFDLLFRFLILSAVVLAIWGLYRILVVWWGLRDCLKSVEVMPLGGAFERLPDSIASLTRLAPFDTPSNDIVDATIDGAAHARWLSLWYLRSTLPAGIRGKLPDSMTGEFPAMRSNGGKFESSIGDVVRVMQIALRSEAQQNPAVLLDTLVTSSTDEKKKAGPAPVGWVPAVQDLVALYVVDYVEWVVRHLRSLATSLLISLVLTTFLLSSYPFEPQGLIKGLFFGLMGAAVISIAVVLFQMNRNPILSRITGTEAGRVNWDMKFAINLVLVAGLPLLSVVSAEFPKVRLFLFAWIAPVMKALGKG